MVSFEVPDETPDRQRRGSYTDYSSMVIDSSSIIAGTPPQPETSIETDMRGSKRSRDEYEAEPDARTPTGDASMPDAPPLDTETPMPRIIFGMCYSIYDRLHSFFGRAFDWWYSTHRPLAIAAVETSPGKRRAVEMDLPGSYPKTSSTQLPTPPDSRPASSDGPSPEEKDAEQEILQQWKQTQPAQQLQATEPQKPNFPTLATEFPETYGPKTLKERLTMLRAKKAGKPYVPLSPNSKHYTHTLDDIRRAAKERKQKRCNQYDNLKTNVGPNIGTLTATQAAQQPLQAENERDGLNAGQEIGASSSHNNTSSRELHYHPSQVSTQAHVRRSLESNIGTLDTTQAAQQPPRAENERDGQRYTIPTSPNNGTPNKALLATYPSPQAGNERDGREKDHDIDSLVDRATTLAVSRRRDRDSIRQYKEHVDLTKSQAREAELAKEQKIALAKQIEEDKRIALEEAKAAKLKEEREAEEAKKKAEEAAARAKEQIIKPLDEDWTQKLKEHMSKGKDHVIAMSPDGNELTRHDFATLLGSEKNGEASAWLNDEIVNAFLSTIVSRKNDDAGYKKSAKTVPNYASYNTAWYNTYKQRGLDGIATWSRRKHIKGEKLLQVQKVYFPINTGAHWMLLIISPKERKIEFLDSLGFRSGKAATWMEFGRKWLQMELGSLYKAEEWTESKAKSSMQLNGNDCGAFTCFNALASASDEDFGKVRGDDMQNGRKMLAAVLCGWEGW